MVDSLLDFFGAGHPFQVRSKYSQTKREADQNHSPVPNRHDPFSRWFVLCLDRIEGVEAPEYGVETSVEDKTVTCWIPSELGKVKLPGLGLRRDRDAYYRRRPSPSTGKTLGTTRTPWVIVDLDGTHCPGMIIRARSGRVPNAAEVAGGTDGSMLSAFMFSSLDLTDDDSFLGSSVNEDLGNIELSIYPVIEESFDEPQQLCNPNLDKVTLHERSKKAVTQQITLAEPEPERYTVASSTITCSGPDIVTFCFKYRPLDLLQANGIAPTTQVPKKEASSPAEEEVEVEEDTVDEEEIRALRDRLSILEAKRAVKKKKRVDVKSEFDLLSDLDPRPKKKLKIKREVIDLTL
ncbi:hypothetical protein FB45DRAFT_181563 [Roridomyces roridus]|uniref:DUF7918 domain-containing protein n=1 Tax=Roridomyces roridus TaxID=1738132 RepID=A0AAD7CE35_9AGAR|nr:hypothetical protein FB45DRAFT_181563 [Roridomyces roridus]